MLDRNLRSGRGTRAALLGGAVALAVSLAPAVHGQMGPRTMGNSGFGLDAAGIGDQLSISSADRTTKKMELTRELQYLDAARWQASAVTWLHFREGEGGEILVAEKGPGVVQELKAPKKWRVEPVEGGGWMLIPEKGGGKLDLYLETVFKGDPFSVGAVVPKFEGEAFGAVYRGMDFLFFVVQKKHPEPAAAG